jgi:hypothetical protein
MLLLRKRRSVQKNIAEPTESKSDYNKPKTTASSKVVKQEEDTNVIEIEGITLRDPYTNKTFKLKANAAVCDAFGCICKEEDEHKSTDSAIPDHVLAMALQNAN